MKKINALTTGQIAKFPQYVKEWTDIGLSTSPADRPKAEAAIVKMYAIAGKKAPKIVWCSSPLSQGLTRHAVMNLPASVRASVGASVGAGVRASVWDSVRDSVWASVGASVRASVGAGVRDSVWASVWASVGDSVGASVGASVRASVGAGVRDSVWASVRDSVRDSVWASVGAGVRASVWASVRDSVRDSVWASVWDSVGASVRDSVYGSHDANWLAFYKFFEAECGLTAETEKLSGLWELSQSAGWALPHENICWVSERHTQIHQTRLPNGRYQLHCETGPAVAYPDGWSLFYIHGVAVPEQVVMQPETLTLKQISDESNAEVRRIMVDRYGYEKYLRESKAELINECAEDHALKGLRTAKLWSIGEIIMLDVLNSTPEPDGTTKRYVIPVDGSLYGGRAGRECLAASASTWRKRGDKTQLAFARPEDYAPAFES